MAGRDSGKAKRRAPEPCAEVQRAQSQTQAEWEFPKSKWKTKGIAKYSELKKKVERGGVLEEYNKYLMEVHSPKIAPSSHEINGSQPARSPLKRTKGNHDEPVFGDLIAQASLELIFPRLYIVNVE